MSVQYTRVPIEDDSGIDEYGAIDFSSPFLYENTDDIQFKYRSAFSYSGQQKKVTRIVAPEQHRACQSLPQKILHILITVCCAALLIATFPITMWFSIKKASLYERLVVFRLGRLIGTKGPGLVFVLPCIDRWHRVDTRMRAFKVPPKQVVTADGAIIQIGADVYYRIAMPERSVTNVQNLDRATRILVETGMQNELVHKKMAEIESQRAATGETIKEASNKSSMDWGIELFRVDLSEITVLRKPPQRSSAPTMVMPPGLLGEGGAGGAMGPALQQMFSAIMQASAGQQTQEADGAVGGTAQPGVADSSEWNSAEFESVQPAAMDRNMSGYAVEGADEGLTPEEMVLLVRCVLSEALVQKVRAVYYFDIIGHGGGQFYLDLKHGSGSVGQGPPPSSRPDTIIRLSLENMRALLLEEVGPMAAYMSGRLRVEGDLTAAYRLDVVVQALKEERMGRIAVTAKTQASEPEGAMWA